MSENRGTRGAALVALSILASAGAAHAASSPRPALPASATAGGAAPLAAAARAAAGPPGYAVVQSDLLTDPAGQQTHAEVACPAGSVPTGGGALVGEWLGPSDLGETINDSFPSDSGWVVDVNNATAQDGSFRVYAVCGNPKGYRVVTTEVFDMPVASWATEAQVDCPAHTKVLGGGVESIAHVTGVNYWTSAQYPISNGLGWVVDFSRDRLAASVPFEVYAICGKVKRDYTVVTGTESLVGAGTREQLNVYCPVGTVPLSGGIWTSTYLSVVAMNSTLPLTQGGWSVYENNTSDEDVRIFDSVVCE